MPIVRTKSRSRKQPKSLPPGTPAVVTARHPAKVLRRRNADLPADEAEAQARADAANRLWRELVRRATGRR